jgi:hypothetical protein
MNSLYDMVTGEFLDEQRLERAESAALDDFFALQLGLLPVTDTLAPRREIPMPPELADLSVAAFIANQQ